jgi:predicted transcriptional regulator
MATDKSSPEAIERQRARARALELREKRWSYQQIGDDLGVTRSTAFKYVQRAMTDIIREPAEQVLALELADLDAYTKQLNDRLESAYETDDLVKLLTVALRVQARRSKLHGFDHKAILDLNRETGSVPDAMQYLALMLGETAPPAAAADDSDGE